MRIKLLVPAVAGVALLASCGTSGATASSPSSESSAAGTTVTVKLLSGFKIEASPNSVKAGSVTFKVTDKDDEDHEMVLMKTDLAADALPYDKATGKVPEEGTGLESMGEVAELHQGASGTLTADLKPGKYVLMCNIAETKSDGTVEGHYGEGMYLPFTVTS